MKNSVLYYAYLIAFCMLLFVSNAISAQSSSKSDTIYTVKGYKSKSKLFEGYKTVLYVDEAPQFKGGKEKMLEFIENNMRYPKLEREDTLTSRKVRLKYTITAEGDIENISVIRGLAPALDAEAVRLMELLPKMQPGKKKNKVVPTLVTYTVTFKNIKSPLIGEDRMPEYPGGEKAMLRFVQRNLKYPSEARNSYEEGSVIVRFVIDKTGKITNVSVLRSVGSSCDAEAVRIVKSMPKWKPGLQEGEPVPVQYTLPITFKLN